MVKYERKVNNKGIQHYHKTNEYKNLFLNKQTHI